LSPLTPATASGAGDPEALSGRSGAAPDGTAVTWTPEELAYIAAMAEYVLRDAARNGRPPPLAARRVAGRAAAELARHAAVQVSA
jgi:hypothetical protein